MWSLGRPIPGRGAMETLMATTWTGTGGRTRHGPFVARGRSRRPSAILPAVRADGTDQLLDGARRGDDVARAVLLEQSRPRLLLWLASRCPASVDGSPDTVELAQRVLTSLDADFRRFAGGDAEAFRTWLFSRAEATLACLTEAPRPRRVTLLEDAPTETCPDGPSPAVEPMHRALAGLAEPHREILRLRRFEEHPWTRIAERLQVDEAAVCLRYCRALGALREALTAQGSES